MAPPAQQQPQFSHFLEDDGAQPTHFVEDRQGAPPPPKPPARTAPPSLGSRFLSGAEDFGKGVLKGGLNTVNGVSGMIHQLPLGIGEKLVPASGLTAAKMYAQPSSTTQAVGKGAEQAAEFLVPGIGEEGAGLKLAEHAPQLGRMAAPIARMGVQALGSGAINKMQGGSFGAGAAAGAVGSGIGEAMRAAAPALAETALRVRGNDRLYGRTVGDAILNDTRGIRPGTIAKSAQSKISELTPEVEQKAAQASQSGATGSLMPAKIGVAQTMANHINNYAPDSAAELEPLENRLAVHSRTGALLNPDQPPSELLRMKRGLNSDFIQNWKPDQPPGLRSSAKTAYGNLADAFHAAAPGTKELDQRISSLIPVTKRAEAADNAAGLVQRTAGRIGAHTGALSLGIGGAYAGKHEAGLPGAIAGGAIGILAPEMLSSPEGQMIMARVLKGAAPRYITPFMKGVALQAERGNR